MLCAVVTILVSGVGCAVGHQRADVNLPGYSAHSGSVFIAPVGVSNPNAEPMNGTYVSNQYNNGARYTYGGSWGGSDASYNNQYRNRYTYSGSRGGSNAGYNNQYGNCYSYSRTAEAAHSRPQLPNW